NRLPIGDEGVSFVALVFPAVMFIHAFFRHHCQPPHRVPWPLKLKPPVFLYFVLRTVYFCSYLWTAETPVGMSLGTHRGAANLF
ncbi:hypothetical protein NPN14_23655, partial [Vibrio parahaemolyticus]|uniref:hypothetical protein n=1 Tax=Vibrio parahaemolyticus TaxID=670 RepID=UPI0021131848